MRVLVEKYMNAAMPPSSENVNVYFVLALLLAVKLHLMTMNQVGDILMTTLPQIAVFQTVE
jgi:hypothetical protein